MKKVTKQAASAAAKEKTAYSVRRSSGLENIQVWVQANQVAALQNAAQKQKITRAEVVRKILADWVGKEEKKTEKKEAKAKK